MLLGKLQEAIGRGNVPLDSRTHKRFVVGEQFDDAETRNTLARYILHTTV